MLEHVVAVIEELAGRRVEGDHQVHPRRIAGRLDRVDQEVERGLVGLEVRREAALVSSAGREPLLAQDPLQRVVGLGSHPQALREGLRARRDDHELLKVDLVVGVGSAIEHVHHRHRELHRRARVPGAGCRVEPAEVLVERHAGLGRCCLGRSHRGAQDRVCPQPALVGGAVQLDHGPVERPLVRRVRAPERVRDLAVDVRDGPAHRLAAVLIAAVAQLHRLVLASRGARRHSREATGAGVEHDLDLDRRVAPRVEHLPAVNAVDRRHRAGKATGRRVASVPSLGDPPGGLAQRELRVHAQAARGGDGLEQQRSDQLLGLGPRRRIGPRAARLLPS